VSNDSHIQHDFRVQHTELRTLRQRLADTDSKYARIEKDLDVSKSNSLKLRERIVSQVQQLESERQDNARELERLRKQLESQAKLLEETEAHLDGLRASSNHRLSRIGDEASISVYHSRITALETRLDQLKEKMKKPRCATARSSPRMQPSASSSPRWRP
jgi:chromosome segregation ATPase